MLNKKNFFYLLITLFCLWFFKRFLEGLDIADLLSAAYGAYYRWAWIALLLYFLCHVFRAYRWKLLLAHHNLTPSLGVLLMAEMSGLFTTTIVPRAGELVRCQILKKKFNIPLSKSFASIVVERFSDMVFYIILFLVWFFMIGSRLNISILEKVKLYFATTSTIKVVGYTLLLLVGKGVVAGFLYRAFKKNLHWTKEIRKGFLSFWQGMKLSQRAGFARIGGLTLIIWFTHFLSVWALHQAFEETGALAWQQVLSVFLITDLVILIPVPGNVGGLHFILAYVLKQMAVSPVIAASYAALFHLVHLSLALVIGGMYAARSSVWLSSTPKPAPPTTQGI
jgi:uncharacterized protein (TIRG00374 family)